MNERSYRTIRRQKGLTTLAIVLLLLFVATLVTLYTANTAVREQQVSANQYRADQALSAANAALDYALAYYTKNSGPDANDDGVIDTLTIPSSLLTGQNLVVTAQVEFTDGKPTVDTDGDGTTDNDAADRPHTVRATGFSDDASATRTIEVQVDSFGVLPSSGMPGFPLVARGIAASGGNFTIINRFSNATIWTGADATAIGSAETYVFDPENPATTPEEMVDITGLPDPNMVLHASYSAAGLNSDVLESDNNLANMNGDEFFENFMIESRTTVRAMAESIGQRFDADSIRWNDLEVSDGVKGLVWIDGDWSESGTLYPLGSKKHPIALVIDGDFTTTGTGTPGIDVMGLIYVAGDWDSGGNFEVQGGMMVEGTVDNKGKPTIVYDEDMFVGRAGNPPGNIAALIAGTWKDW